MVENKNNEKCVHFCTYIKSISSVLTSCFPSCKSNKSVSMAGQDKLQHLDTEWQELYKRVSHLENIKHTDTVSVEPVPTNNSNHHIQTYVTDEIKQLFTRIDNIEKKMDEYLVVQKANADTMKKLDDKLKKIDEGSWYSVDMNNNSISSNSSRKSTSPVSSVDTDNLSGSSDNLDIQSIDNMDMEITSSDSDTDIIITN